ncbi:methyltransferase domain-containing protein [Tanticharoenia sakaeratensis]|uniref:Methyltransferase n=1 Tax=Tanticharoenia sakaeratensis NBRC 103193 TaxID=1231623 RepID=A0A0D6MJQ9_9PROT|nr:methyltransferase domain-containing protein [Tanticharoenia sakaeratensis]GAN53705.1 methyltransferase [Tanticharoenia sakaeratensis NBRC 103193]GBQ17138.1 SAM-dependent methyltransferase [Tanticharoenia sakaeratensis NBRC 103193]
MSIRRPSGGLLHAADFYAGPHGALTRTLLVERLRRMLPPLGARRVLGLGFASPYLDQLDCDPLRTVSGRPDNPLTRITAQYAGSAMECAIDETALPFDDLSIDLVLAVHAVELMRDPRESLRAIWKVLADDGFLVLVLPNRTGLWAHGDMTPFGHGAPYSAWQIERTLKQSMFRAERLDGALAVPPVALHLGRRTARAGDRAMGILGRRFAGVHVVVARKDVYAAMPLAPEGAVGRLKRRILELA